MLLEEITNPKTNPALMTFDEFQKFTNPSEKIHPNDAYDYDLEKLNTPYFQHIQSYNFGNGQRTVYQYKNYILLHHENVVVGVLDTDTNTFYVEKSEFETDDKYIIGDYAKNYKLQPKRYPEKIVKDEWKKERKSEYSILINRKTFKDKSFEVRQNSSKDIAVFDGLDRVAVAQNEWGAILIAVAREYRSYGLGTYLSKLIRERTDLTDTGGVTYSGSKQLRRSWEEFVREYLNRGLYQKAIQSGLISKEKVMDIVRDLGARRKKETAKKESPGRLVILSASDSEYIIVDSRIFSHWKDYSWDTDTEDLEKYIKARLYIQGFGDDKNYVFSNNYDDESFEPILLNIALENVKKHGERMVVHDREDSSSIAELPNVSVENDEYVLKKDYNYRSKVFDLKNDSLLYAIIEIAMMKY